MPVRLDAEIRLSFEPLALERCYIIGDILHERFAEPYMEYALLGLSAASSPFHVVATPLLPGQRVTPATVEQPGREVFRMRHEMELLSKRLQRRLVPIAFIHRHLSRCDASRTDDVFLRGVFVDQVSTVVSFEELRPLDPGERPCGCPGMQRLLREAAARWGGPPALRCEHGVALSLIVNRRREHQLYAVRKDLCPFCGRGEVRYVPARLAADPRGPVSALDRALLRKRLEVEIEAKIRFDRDWDAMGRMQ